MNGDLTASPHNWTEDFGHENGQYLHVCPSCVEQFVGHKRRVVCKVCANSVVTKAEPLPVAECAPAGIPPAPCFALLDVGQRLRTQSNRMTQNPMFCLQILVRDWGYDAAYASETCWWNSANEDLVFKEPEDLEGWEEFGYKDRWDTVMVAFTEEGLNEYMRQDGWNVKRRAFNGETRIYVESFNRCPEMIMVRKWVLDSTGNGQVTG